MYKLLILAAILVAVHSQDLDAIMMDLYGSPYGPTEAEASDVSASSVPSDHQGPRLGRQAALRGTVERDAACKVRGAEGRCVHYSDCKHSFYLGNGQSYWPEAAAECRLEFDVCCPGA